MFVNNHPVNPGLPPNGSQEQFLGFDNNGWAYVLRWARGGHWLAIGYNEPTGNSPNWQNRRGFILVNFNCSEVPGLIVGWVPLEVVK